MPQLLDKRFTSLADSPNDYTGNGGDLVRVNFTADALEFVSPEDLDIGANTFIDLLDTPNSYSESAFKFLRVNSDESGVEFVNANVIVGGSGEGNLAEPTSFIDLTDTPEDYINSDGNFVRVSSSSLIFSTPLFTDLIDVPSDYTGQANKQLVVNSTGDGISFSEPTDTFISLTDTPNSYGVSDGGRVVRVKQDRTGLTFSDYTFTSLSDTPDSYLTFSNRIIKVNSSGNGLVFAEEIDRFIRLTDTPNSYGVDDGGKLVRVKQDRTGLEFVNTSEVVSTSFSFLDLIDTPSSYQLSDVGKYIQVIDDAGDGVRLRFAEASAIASGLPTVIIELKLYDENYVEGTNRPAAIGENAVAIGESCIAVGLNSNVAGGKENVTNSLYSVVAGGNNNIASGLGAAITGGQDNTILSGSWHTILSGTNNSIENNSHCGIVGGSDNTIRGPESSYSIIIGGKNNNIETSLAYGTLRGSTIIGGLNNSILRDNSLIAGGINNTVTAPECLILGGENNLADGDYGTIIGGQWATTRQLYNAQVFAAKIPDQTKRGQNQSSILLYSLETSPGSGFQKMLLDGGGNHGGRQNLLSGYVNRFLFPDEPATFLMIFKIMGVSLNGGNCAAFELKSLVRLNGGILQNPCVPTKTTVCKTPGASNWDVRLLFGEDSTGEFVGNFVDLEVNGDQNLVRWIAKLETLEIVI
jgi:hypothetical protein